MAKDRKKLQHIHSSIPDKQPTPQTLEVGEIAVNNAANQEFLSIKNTDDKVVRFSSDGQIIEWMERKEVMPYEGYTRGSDGPDGSTGPDSVTNDDLLQNKSNIIIKLNQVAASATTKHDKVNGAKDIYNKEVNPTNDGGVTDGAGFAIDMSRYAMIGANPSFSSLTVTDKTDLSGNTTITDGDGTGTRTGKTFTVNVTNENETVANLNESATTRTTIVGTENLTISGTTTEVHNEQVTITNNNGVTETTKGNVVDNVSGTTTINHSGTTTTNVSANTVFNTTGTTTINSTGSTTIQSTGDDSDVTIYAKDDLCATSDDVAAFKGANKTNVGIDCSDAGRTKITNVYGDTINVRANSADTRVTSAYTSATTATTIIGTANTSATTADYSGNTLNSHIKSWTHSGDTLNITESTSTTLKSPATTVSGTTLTVDEGTSISAKTPTAYLSGTTLDVNETNTDITSCGRISANTNDFEVKQCAANGKAIINSDDVDISGKTFDVVETTSATIKAPATTISGTSLTLDEGTSISAKTHSTTISGTNFTLNETNTTINSCGKVEITTDSYSLKQCSNSGGTADFEFCNGFNVKSNAVKFEQCSTAGTFTVIEKGTSISGETLTIRESGATDFSGNTLTTTTAGNTNINVNGNLTEKVTGNTNINTTGNTNITSSGATTLTSTGTTTIEATGTNSDVCISATVSARVYGKGSTYVGVNCAGTPGSATTIEGTTLVLSGNTTNISGATTLNLSGKTVNVDATDIDVDASNNYCVSAATKANFYGNETNIGVDCGGTTATTINVSGTTINEGGTTLNETFTNGNLNIANYDLNGTNICISGSTKANVYGATTNVGIDCNNTTTAGTINISGTSINEGGKNINMYTTEKTCIQAGTDLNIGGDTTTNVGAKCDGTVYSNNTTINAQTAVTINAPTTNITGNTNISGDTIIKGDLYVSGTTYGLEDLTTNYGVDVSNSTETTKYNGSEPKTISIPTTLAQISASHIKDSNPTASTGIITIDKATNITGATTVRGNTDISGDTTNITGTTKLNLSGNTVNIDGRTINIESSGNACIEANDTLNLGGVNEVKIGYDCSGIPITKDIRIHADKDINVNSTGFTLDSDLINISGYTTIDGNTNIKGNTSIRGNADISGITITETSTDNICIQAGTDLNIGGSSTTKIGYNCSGIGYSPDTRIYGEDSVTINSDYVNVNSNNISAYTTSKGSNLKVNDVDSNMSVVRLALNGADQALLLSHNKLCNDGVTRSFFTLRTNRKSDNQQCINIQTFDTENGGCTCIGGGKVESDSSYTTGITGDYVNVGFISKRDAIVKGKLWVEDNVCVTGTVTASGAIYSSDKNLKENINSLKGNKSIFDKVADVDVVSFNFKDDESKNTKYGVIAQDVQKAGLEELVHESNGNLGVDYTSLLMLKIAYLENTIKNLTEKIEKLENK